MGPIKYDNTVAWRPSELIAPLNLSTPTCLRHSFNMVPIKYHYALAWHPSELIALVETAVLAPKTGDQDTQAFSPAQDKIMCDGPLHG